MASNWDLDTLKEINESVNDSVTYQSDIETFEDVEHWEVADDVGDCEDYALLKLHKCLEEGIPIEKLMLATCYCENDEYHAVLAVDYKNTFYILDNRSSKVLPHNEIKGYRFDKRQSKGGSKDWIKFK